ncbi:MAG: hypothetical protein EXS03_09890 [Phycisphaerales bacterium]|nr:hypothetical protein [Phycisphaerales bacterium]
MRTRAPVRWTLALSVSASATSRESMSPGSVRRSDLRTIARSVSTVSATMKDPASWLAGSVNG